MKAGLDGGSQTYQHIQIPLLMPCRYERDTADTQERIYVEREKERADARYQSRRSLILLTRKTLLADHHPQSKSGAALRVHASRLTGFHA